MPANQFRLIRQTSRPVAVILRPGKTPQGKEVLGWLRPLFRRIRRFGPTAASPFAATAITTIGKPEPAS